MINKDRLINFVNKYNLDASSSGRKDNAVKLESTEDGSLFTNFMSDDKTVMGKIKYKDIFFPTGEYGVYDTSKFLALIKLMQSEFNVEVTHKQGKSSNATSLIFKDDIYKSEFILASLDIIPKGGTINTENLPEFELSFNIDSLFIDKYNKALGAIGGELVAFVQEDDSVNLVVNYTENSSHTIKIKIDCESPTNFGKILFKSDVFKDILLANKDLSAGQIKISNQGLMQLMFKNDFGNALYLLVAQQM